MRKPYIYTGSWMEGIKNIEELYDLVKDIPPSEAIIRAFNILCPYDEVNSIFIFFLAVFLTNNFLTFL